MKHWKKKPWVDSDVRNWDYIADHIAPDATASDAGKVLTVGETGKPEWGEGGGSGGGLILYGPYVASCEAEDSISPSDVVTLSVSAINDPNTGDAYERDETVYYYRTFVQSILITSSGVALVGYDNPAYESALKVINVTDSTLNEAFAEVFFYADHPLIKIEE